MLLTLLNDFPTLKQRDRRQKTNQLIRELWDLGYTYWQAGDQAGGRHAVSFAPVFVYEFGEGNIKPFVEAGIGVAVFSGTTAGDQKFGSAFNFEDRIGAGIKIGDTQKVGLRVIHYSNASIKAPNDGIESYSFFYSHSI